MTYLLTVTPQLLNIGNDYGDFAFLAGMGIVLIIFILVALIPGIFFLLTLQNTLKVISPQNRKILPGKVWLLLIPFWGFVWMFVVVNRVAKSIYEEYKSRGVPIQNKPTQSLGRAMSILICIHFIFSVINFILKYVLVADEPVVIVLSYSTFLLMLAELITWIIYWVKVNEYKNLILTLPKADQQAQSGDKYFTT